MAKLAVDPSNIFDKACDQTAEICEGSKSVFAQGGLFESVASTLMYVIGGVSVIFIILGGLRYVTSAGDPSSIKSAKDTILYAIVGLVVAIVARLIISYVIENVG